MINLIKSFNFIKLFLIKKNFILINSPLQFVNLIEYFYQQDKQTNEIVYIGYTNKVSQNQIKLLNKKFKKNFKLIFLSENISLLFFHKLLYLKKKFSDINQCILGDINYYLFKEFYKFSKKNIVLDDGTSSLQNNFHEVYKKKISIFSIFKRNFKSKKINFIKNNLKFLKSKLVKQNSNKNIIYIIGSASVEREVISEENFKKILVKITSLYKNKKIYYFPHRLEYNSKILKKIKKLKIKIINQNFESQIITQKNLPNKIFGFYSTALFNLKIIYGSKVQLININYSFNDILDTSIKKRHMLIKKYYSKFKIKSLKF